MSDPHEPPAAPKDGVPPKVIDELHQANQKLHRASEHLGEATASVEYGSLEKREQASQEIGVAENEIEEIDKRIKEKLEKSETGT